MGCESTGGKKILSCEGDFRKCDNAECGFGRHLLMLSGLSSKSCSQCDYAVFNIYVQRVKSILWAQVGRHGDGVKKFEGDWGFLEELFYM